MGRPQSREISTELGGEESAYKDPVQRLWIIRGRQHARILHVRAQVPELLQSHARNIDNIVRLRDGRAGQRPVPQCGAHGQRKVDEVLVEGEEAVQLRWNGSLAFAGMVVLGV